jgi:transposase-like protein
MEKKMRRKHSSEFKAKVALEALKEQKTMSQISQEYMLHANQISDWKKVVTERATELFESTAPAAEPDIESITAPLYQQIGQLKVEMDFLKKKLKQSSF